MQSVYDEFDCSVEKALCQRFLPQKAKKYIFT